MVRLRLGQPGRQMREPDPHAFVTSVILPPPVPVPLQSGQVVSWLSRPASRPGAPGRYVVPRGPSLIVKVGNYRLWLELRDRRHPQWRRVSVPLYRRVRTARQRLLTPSCQPKM